MLDPRIRATLDKVLGAFQASDPGSLVSCFAEGVLGFEGRHGAVCRSAEELSTALMDSRQGLPAGSLHELGTFGAGPELALRLEWRAGAESWLAMWVFRFDEEARITRLEALWEASAMEGESLEPDPRATVAIESYFRTYTENDEDGHMALVSPDLVYFGAVSRMTAIGIATARGVFRGARDSMGIRQLDPLRIYGVGPVFAVLARMSDGRPEGRATEGLWSLHLDPQFRFDRVSILWNPGSFLVRDPS